MGNHFHLLVRMLPDTDFSDADMLKRLAAYYGDDRVFGADQLPAYRQKLASLSEFVGEIKVRFARFYNKRHGRRGYFWGGSLQKRCGGKWRNPGQLPGLY